MSGGPGILTFNARRLGGASGVYMEPDFIMLTAPASRCGFTVLYRHGKAVRTLTARGPACGPPATAGIRWTPGAPMARSTSSHSVPLSGRTWRE